MINILNKKNTGISQQETFFHFGEVSQLPGQPIRVYTLKQVASIFYVTLRTIYNWKEQGILPCTIIGSKTYLTEAQLQEFLKDHEVKPLKRMRA